MNLKMVSCPRTQLLSTFVKFGRNQTANSFKLILYCCLSFVCLFVNWFVAIGRLNGCCITSNSVDCICFGIKKKLADTLKKLFTYIWGGELIQSLFVNVNSLRFTNFLQYPQENAHVL